MYRLASCIVLEHDPALAAIALAVCAAGSLVAVRLLKRTLGSRGRQRIAWIFIGAIAAGSTTWCTHFVAMLAYRPDVSIAYDPTSTFVSLLVAVVGSVASFGIASEGGRARVLGGAAFGVTVAAMHYTGMMAVSAAATVDFRAEYVALSILAAVALGAPAFRSVGGSTSGRAILGSAAVLAAAVLSLHFLGMASLDIVPFPAPEGMTVADATRAPLAIAVAGVGLLILGIGAVSHLLDSHAETSAAARVRHLAESAVDGMALVRDGVIVEVNAALELMAGRARGDLIGRGVGEVIEAAAVPEGELAPATLHAGAAPLAVELVVSTEPTGEGALSVYTLRDISERLAQEDRIAYLARFDPLTGLINRAAFIEEARRVLSGQAPGRRVALLVIDLDRLKDVNDARGHAAGDRVLAEVGRRLALIAQPADLAARLDGDEFVVLAPVESRQRALALAEEIAALLGGPVALADGPFGPSVSIGIASFPSDGTEINGLLNNADLALVRSKALGRGRRCLYDRSMDDAVRAQRGLVEDLRRAIDDDALTLHYQPQVRIADETATGYEALVRWSHPARGPISPGEFIPLAERTGLIVALGERVFHAACREATRWLDHLTVSINVSPLQLDDPMFCASVRAALAETGIDPGRVEIEVTEQSFITDEARAKRVLEELKSLGLSIAIDDFGVGYSSIGMLQAFPFDKIKLDKVFVDRLAGSKKAQGILRSVLSLGEALEVPVVAEGVETPEQLRHLRAERCSLVQGYICGRPQPHIDQRFLRAARAA